jgi:alpha-mannosidase
MSNIHVFTHTHWDREWFLTADQTSEELDNLFTRLFEVIDQCPDYRYILDGQTLMIEDYLRTHPEREELFRQKAAAGNLLIGPYYGQVDWRAVSEESLMRNMYLGIKDAKSYGNLMPYGWMMDNFGHCSQGPQIHRLFGIQEVFLWRGPVFEHDEISSDFVWQGSDGSEIYTNYLMSGYRNFYNLTDTTEFIDGRVNQLCSMLEPFTPHKNFAFLNGYDLDVFPEDPFPFLEGRENIIRSTPEQYSKAHREYFEQRGEHPPVVKGELYSGKYASIFPGSLSARTYLRIENALIERLLTYYLEPVQALLSHAGVEVDAARTETFWRDLLKTQLHDNLGAVGIDQIHDNMEVVYRNIYHDVQTLLTDSVAYLPSLLDLQPGKYAFMPSPFAYEQLWLHGKDGHYRISSPGTGVVAIQEERPALNEDIAVDSYTWKNDFYTFEISTQGATLNGKSVGTLLLERDAGDTYNADPEPFADAPKVSITSLRKLEECDDYARIAVQREISHEGICIRTEEEVVVANTPVVEWTVTVDSEGTDYRLRLAYETGDTDSDVFAKMPYDIYQRPRTDENYFGEDIPQALRPVLLACREVNKVVDFPFQGFAALSDSSTTKAVLAKGLREYEVDEQGRIIVTLKRSVEWLAKSKLRTRVGDAGPYMYLPGARDERKITVECAFIDMNAAVRSPEFLQWFYQFEYGALIFENTSFEGTQSAARLWEERVPWAGIQTLEPGKSLIRLYNPGENTAELVRSHTAVDSFGDTGESVQHVSQNAIVQLQYQPTVKENPVACAGTAMFEWPEWPIGPLNSTVDVTILDGLRTKIEEYKHEQADAKAQLADISEEQDALRYHQLKHKDVRLAREILELELSILLNELKRQGASEELHQRIQAVGKELNLCRRHRRTYDYILSLFENQ